MSLKKPSEGLLLMLFRSPMQSWGASSKFNSRLTLDHPTKSGTIGLIGAAMGMQRNDEAQIATLSQMKIDVVSAYDFGTTIKDFQTIGAGYNRVDKFLYIPHTKDGAIPVQAKKAKKKDKNEKADKTEKKERKKDESPANAVVTTRYYLCDYIFFVILQGEKELIERIKSGLCNPEYPIYFGRKCNVPSDVVFRGIFDSHLEISGYILKYLEECNIDKDKTTVIEDSCKNPSSTINDVPINFQLRTHKTRIVSLISPKEYFEDEHWEH